MGRTTYIGFLVDWFLDMIFIIANFISFNITASIFVGIFLYINGMVKDMKTRFTSINDDFAACRAQQISQSNEIWSIYIQEIELHIGIIGYLSLEFIQGENYYKNTFF